MKDTGNQFYFLQVELQTLPKAVKQAMPSQQ